MDGIFVAFHNTSQIQGFQYLNLGDMDKRLFGDRTVGDAVFRMCVGLLEKVYESVKKYFPSQVSTRTYWRPLSSTEPSVLVCQIDIRHRQKMHNPVCVGRTSELEP